MKNNLINSRQTNRNAVNVMKRATENPPTSQSRIRNRTYSAAPSARIGTSTSRQRG